MFYTYSKCEYCGFAHSSRIVCAAQKEQERYEDVRIMILEMELWLKYSNEALFLQYLAENNYI